MKTLSVIIPHYNSQATLARLLKTIPVLPWIEVVVVDDHSEQPISETLRVQFSNVTFIDNEIGNKGPGSARNLGVSQATGNWIVFADSDDYFLEDAFSFMAEYLDKSAELVLFYPTSKNLETNQEAKRHLYISQLLNEFKQTGKREPLYKFLAVWSAMVSRDLMINNSIKFGDEMTGEDMIVSIKMKYFANTIRLDDRKIYCVTETSGSLMTKRTEALAWQRFYATCAANQFFNQHGLRHCQIPINLEIYELRHYGAFKVFKGIIFAVKNGSSLLKGSKFLVTRLLKGS